MTTYRGPVFDRWDPRDLDLALRDRLLAVLADLPHDSVIRWWDRAADADRMVAHGYVDVCTPGLAQRVGTARLWTVNPPCGDDFLLHGPLGLIVEPDLRDPDAWTVERLDEQLTGWVHGFGRRDDIAVRHDPEVLRITPPITWREQARTLRAQYTLRDRMLDAIAGLPDGSMFRWHSEDGGGGPWKALCPEVQIHVPALSDRLGTSRLWLAVDADRVDPLPRAPLVLPVHRALGSRRGLNGMDVSEAIEGWVTRRTGRTDLVAMYDAPSPTAGAQPRFRAPASPVSAGLGIASSIAQAHRPRMHP